MKPGRTYWNSSANSGQWRFDPRYVLVDTAGTITETPDCSGSEWFRWSQSVERELRERNAPTTYIWDLERRKIVATLWKNRTDPGDRDTVRAIMQMRDEQAG